MIISFLVDGFISKYAPYSILSLVSLIFLSKKNLKKYYLEAFILGLLFDYFYSNTFFYNSFIFLETAFLIKKFQEKISSNFLNFLLIVILIVINYYTVCFIILALIKYISFDIERYIYVTLNSVELNLILAIIMYLINKKRHKINW